MALASAQKRTLLRYRWPSFNLAAGISRHFLRRTEKRDRQKTDLPTL